MHPAIPWAVGGVASLLTVLRIRKVVVDNKAKTAAPAPQPQPQLQAQVNPLPQPSPQASLPFPVPAFPAAIPPLQAQVNPLPQPIPSLQAQVNPLPQQEPSQDNVLPVAIVTTQDPAPSGDLVIRVAPNDNAAKVIGEGAEKNGSVTILTGDVPDNVTGETGKWAEVMWLGGTRRPASQGFAKKKFLKII